MTSVVIWLGFMFAVFMIDVFARMIVVCRVSASLRTDLPLGLLKRHCGGPGTDKLVHYSDRGVQCVAIRHTERVAEADIEPSLGSVGDSYDNALAETINGFYKTEVIRHRDPWHDIEDVEFVTRECCTGSRSAFGSKLDNKLI